MKSTSRSLYWHFKNLYTPSEIKSLNKNLLNNVSSLKDIAAEPVIKTADVKIIKAKAVPKLNRIFEAVHSANRQNFGFNLYSSITDRQTVVNYNVYSAKSKGEYAYHTDADYYNPVRDIKLTAILNLSTGPYEGGKFYLNPSGQEIPVPEINDYGALIIFPAWFLHKVTPVTKGKRISLSWWGEGPKFI